MLRKRSISALLNNNQSKKSVKKIHAQKLPAIVITIMDCLLIQEQKSYIKVCNPRKHPIWILICLFYHHNRHLLNKIWHLLSNIR